MAKAKLNKYQLLIAKLFAACDIDNYPDDPVRIDTHKMSEILEEEFTKVGLLEDDK